MQKIKWYLKQLLPLQYTSTHTEDGSRIRTVWRMWFGRCFDVEETDLGVTIPAPEASDLTKSIAMVTPLASLLGITEDEIHDTLVRMENLKEDPMDPAEVRKRLRLAYSSLLKPSEI